MAEKKTIAFYCSSLTKGGAERVFANLAEYFTEKGYTVYMVTQYKQEDEYCLKPGITRILSDITPGEEKNGRIGNFFARFFKLRNIFKKIKPDIVFSCNGKNNFMAECAGMGLYCRTVVSVVADPKMEYPTKLMRLLAKVLFRFADGIVFQTREAMDFFPKAVRKKGVILPNSLNPQFIRERFEGEREKEIVAVGRLDDNKNHAMLLQAFAGIKEEFPDYRIVIYGEGEDRPKLEKLIVEYGLTGRVSLPGRTDKIEEKIYKSSLFVMTSDTEGMPNALIEAMSLGLCVISTDCPCGGPRELITPGKNGYLVSVRDVGALQKQLRFCLSHPDEMEEMGKVAALIQESMAPDVVNRKWEEYFGEVMG